LEYVGVSVGVDSVEFELLLLGEKILVSFVDDNITDELAPLDGETVGLTTTATPLLFPEEL